MRLLVFFIAIVVGLFLFPVSASAFELGMPIACNYGKDCFIQNYADNDPGSDAQDYQHGRLTYDGHDGTDFRLRDYRAMQQGVAVIAAADGVVERVRDGMKDINVNQIGKDTVMKKGCGNAVVLRHAEGFSSFYCHMKQGSVVVKPGQKVKKGQKLGDIGLSGLTEFPHVHFGVLDDGQKVDPFTGNPLDGKGEAWHPLWDARTAAMLRYIPTGLLNSAFSPVIPEPEAAREGKYTASYANIYTDLLIFWVEIFGIQPEDEITLVIADPGGGVIAEKTSIIPRYKAVFFQYIGKKRRPQGPWAQGTYTGRAILKRKGETVLNEVRLIELK